MNVKVNLNTQSLEVQNDNRCGYRYIKVPSCICVEILYKVG